MDKQPYIARYAWFWADPTFTSGSLVSQNGNPTDLGKVFGYTPFAHA